MIIIHNNVVLDFRGFWGIFYSRLSHHCPIEKDIGLETAGSLHYIGHEHRFMYPIGSKYSAKSCPSVQFLYRAGAFGQTKGAVNGKY